MNRIKEFFIWGDLMANFMRTDWEDMRMILAHVALWVENSMNFYVEWIEFSINFTQIKKAFQQIDK